MCARGQTAKRATGQERGTREGRSWWSAGPQKHCLHYEHIEKLRGALRVLWTISWTVFRSIYAMAGPRFSLYPSFLPSPLSVAAMKPPLAYRSSGSPLPFPLLFFPWASYHGALPRPRCRGPINQCKIFALTGLTEGPRSHLWALKRVANILNKKQLTVAN